MLQYFTYKEPVDHAMEFPIVQGSAALRFFLKRALYLIVFIYSTFFLAVAVPFVKTPCYPIYFLGSLATTILFMRIINYILQYIKYKDGKISLLPDGIQLKGAKKSIKIPLTAITFVELNPFGNIVVREKGMAHSFPFYLLPEDDRGQLVSLLKDMQPGRSNWLMNIWEIIDAVVVALVLAVHIIQFVIQAFFIPTGSMKDTLLVNDHLFVEKLSYGPRIPQMAFMDKPVRLSFLALKKPARGDIVIFKPPHDPDKDYIKRLIALPGDDFKIRNGAVYINGKKLNEPYTRTETTYEQFIERDNIEGIVPPGKVIVLGDNRNNSQDSRYFGYLDMHRLKGRAFILYWNFDQVKKLDFSRFGLIR